MKDLVFRPAEYAVYALVNLILPSEIYLFCGKAGYWLIQIWINFLNLLNDFGK